MVFLTVVQPALITQTSSAEGTAGRIQMIKGLTTVALSSVSLICAVALVVSLERVRIDDGGIGIGAYNVASLMCS